MILLKNGEIYISGKSEFQMMGLINSSLKKKGKFKLLELSGKVVKIGISKNQNGYIFVLENGEIWGNGMYGLQNHSLFLRD